MKVVENKEIDVTSLSNNKAYFLRIDPEDLNVSILEILQNLADMSWLNAFDKDYIRSSFQSNAVKTSRYIHSKLIDKNTNAPIIDEAGEYIVSCLAKQALITTCHHMDIPLMELLGRKISNNPGFDFYTECESILTAGEAKYIKGVNAYNNSLSQINEFILNNKHVEDIGILFFFATDIALENMNNGLFTIGAAFSVTDIDTDLLIKHIVNNAAFQTSIKSNSVFLLGVNMYE